jgi:carbamoyl-phosphate synthase large subunit
MRSTGEVMGHASRFGHAFAKSQIAAGTALPQSGAVLITVNDFDKSAGLKFARDLHRMGFIIYATPGTAAMCQQANLPVQVVEKAQGGLSQIVELILAGKIQLVLNTPLGPQAHSDGAEIRSAAIAMNVPLLTTLSAAMATISAIQAMRKKELKYRSVQSHFERGKRV